ncbi:BTAD domain-containing putative transcriptional regulator [Amycolatopsis sp. cmx-11-12]|uniref:AfsR/SARP family transcriptional regulator n=1 Tax=Amycolatopsis sp. cmx-11-12 TaxID=2785795 RepID=UPI003916DFF3
MQQDDAPPDQGRVTTVRTLGQFSVAINGIRIERWRAGRARQLFQCLLTEAGKPVSKATLIDAVWGDSSARSPDVSLKVAVYNLRNLINDAHRLGHGTGRPTLSIDLHRTGYSLTTNGAIVDVTDFERALDDGARAAKAGLDQQASRHYRTAVDLYTGSYLPECQDVWAMIRREQLKDRLLGAIQELTLQAQRDGDRTVIPELHQRMLQIDPCREESYRELMRWHARANQPSRVMHWYSTCTNQLRTQLGIEPDRSTRQLYYDAVRGDLAARTGGAADR